MAISVYCITLLQTTQKLHFHNWTDMLNKVLLNSGRKKIAKVEDSTRTEVPQFALYVTVRT